MTVVNDHVVADRMNLIVRIREPEVPDTRALYRTRDIECAAYLVYLGHELLCVEPTSSRLLDLYFEPSSDLMVGVNEWRHGDVLVEGGTFLRAFRSVKLRIYQARQVAEVSADA